MANLARGVAVARYRHGACGGSRARGGSLRRQRGANCWFEASTTDSFLIGRADPLLDGLGLLGGSSVPTMYRKSECGPCHLELVGGGGLPAGIACEDGTAGPLHGWAAGCRSHRGAGGEGHRVVREGVGAVEFHWR